MKDRFGQRLMHWRIDAVLPHLRGRVLDVGCGTGDLLRRYREANAGDARAGASVGVDVFDWPGADLLVEDSSDLPYADASFDTVAVVAALNHIPNRGEVLRECRRLLRPGGQIVVTMLPPTLSKLWHRARRPWDADQTQRGMRPGEVWGLTRRQIAALLTTAGFEAVGGERFMLGFNLLMRAEAKATPPAARRRTVVDAPAEPNTLDVAARRPSEEVPVHAVAER